MKFCHQEKSLNAISFFQQTSFRDCWIIAKKTEIYKWILQYNTMYTTVILLSHWKINLSYYTCPVRGSCSNIRTMINPLKQIFGCVPAESERASRCLGLKPLTLPKQGSPSATIVLIEEVISIRCHLPTLIWFPKSHKVTPRRTEPLFFWIYITEPPPKARGNGKMEFPAHFNGQPWASWFEGTTELWHAQPHRVVPLLQDATGLSVLQGACTFERPTWASTLHLTSCRGCFLTRGETNQADFRSIRNRLELPHLKHLYLPYTP